MALRFAGLGSVVERSATKAAIAQASLSAARRGARSNVAHIAPEVAAAYTLRMTRTRVVFRCDQNIMRAMRRALGIYKSFYMGPTKVESAYKPPPKQVITQGGRLEFL